MYLGLQRLTNRLVAIKSLELNKLKDETRKKKILCEVKILGRLSHPGVIRLLEVFENQKYVFLVMELAANGDLLKTLKKLGSVSEAKARKYFFQIAHGLKYIHDNKIIHRDIKLDNILVDENDLCKICDFGVSRTMEDGEIINEQCGTPAYLAPEIILEQGYHGFGADVWSLGVLLFALLTGSMPFVSDRLEVLQEKIVQGSFVFPPDVELGESARDLVRRMLELDPAKRIKMAQVLEHPFVRDCPKIEGYHGQKPKADCKLKP